MCFAELNHLRDQGLSTATDRVVKNLLDYVTQHRKRMDYARFRSLGLPIASGAIESANRQVVGDRAKRSGMRWTRAGLQRILSLRAAFLSGNWDRAFAAIRHRRAIRSPAPLRLLDEATHVARPPIIPHELAPQDTEAMDHQFASRLGIPDRKIPDLLRAGFLRRNAAGQLKEVR